jgi:hypothetical protein
MLNYIISEDDDKGFTFLSEIPICWHDRFDNGGDPL